MEERCGLVQLWLVAEGGCEDEDDWEDADVDDGVVDSVAGEPEHCLVELAEELELRLVFVSV